ncbi:hypothetical protein GP486_001244 [Trichoglossum hirsutum]|uniref:Uncharacterized protein n=1 Tax=Trichoglossum hirsutum TaxID=265104 RepID=A0A9P8LH79_9PEZI|nr:hypothetical protein GP486_001244 [Trichoglossum hirsutum]
MFRNFRSKVTLACLLGLMALILWINRKSPRLTDFGPLQQVKTIAYVLGITIGATIFSQFTTGTMRDLYLQILENPLRRIEVSSSDEADSAATGIHIHQDSVAKLDAKWRVVLRLSTFYETVRLFAARDPETRSKLFIFISYIIFSLLTTSIITTLTPFTFNRRLDYPMTIPDATYGEYLNESDHPCAGMAVSDESKAEVEKSSTFLGWQLNNGSLFYGTFDASWCPQSRAISLAAGIHPRHPDDYAYVDSGVAVHQTALGAPAAIYNGSQFQNFLNTYVMSLMSTTQCVPVMTSNPVQCQTGGKAEVLNKSQLYIESASGDCYYTQTVNTRNLYKDALMVSIMCSTHDINATQADIGRAVMAFGALTDAQGKVAWASDLAQAINDPDPNAGKAPNSTYAVTCTVDPQKVFEYRSVTLERFTPGKSNSSAYAFFLVGGEPCTPVNSTISNILFVTATMANWNIIRENFAFDGYFSTISKAAGKNRSKPYAFPNSRNAMEDVLGLISAMVVANLRVSGKGVVADAIQDKGGRAYAIVQATRIGTHKWYGLLLIIPPLCCTFILCWLLQSNWRRSWIAGGVVYEGPSEDEPKDKRSGLLAGESIYELMSIGQSAGTGSQSAPLLATQSDRSESN